MLKFGGNNIGKVVFGNNVIGRAFLGSELVYQTGGTSVLYNVSFSLSGCSSSNQASQVAERSYYTTTITANSYDYAVSSLSVTMDSVDITSTAYNPSTGVIIITSVTGDIAITASATFWNYAYNDICYVGADGGSAAFSYGGTQDYMLSPLFSLEGVSSVTFSCGSTTREGDLLFFNDDGGYYSYYLHNASPRTVSINAARQKKYCALRLKKTALSVAYIKDNTHDVYLFKGDEYNTNLILSYPNFNTYSPLYQAIPWVNERGDYYEWNFNAQAGAINSVARNVYDPKICRIVKTASSTASQYNTIITKDIPLPQNAEDGKSTITFSLGATYSGNSSPCTFYYNDTAGTATYYTGSSNPRTVTLSAGYNRMRMLILKTKYSDCYVKDAVTDTYLWQGPPSE